MEDVSVTFKSHVTTDSLQDDLDDILDEFAMASWDPAFAVYRIDATTIPDQTTLEQYRNNGKDFLDDLVSPCDSLYYVNWIPKDSDTFSTLAVVATDGTLKYEPVIDAEVAMSGLPPTNPKGEGWDQQKWRNIVGVPKATVEISIQTLGADGCNSEFIGNFISSAGWPFVVEPPNAVPVAVKWCFPKYECKCMVKPWLNDQMECATVTQTYNIIGRIGIDPVSADVISYAGSISAWACADGQCGSGTGQ